MSKGTLKEGPSVGFVPRVKKDYGAEMRINGYPLDLAELMLSDSAMKAYIGDRLGITLEMFEFSGVEDFSGYPLVKEYIDGL